MFCMDAWMDVWRDAWLDGCVMCACVPVATPEARTFNYMEAKKKWDPARRG